jgi:hypothetical protein
VANRVNRPKLRRSAEIRRNGDAGQLSQDMMREIVGRSLAQCGRNGSASLRMAFPCAPAGLTFRGQTWPVGLIGPRRET